MRVVEEPFVTRDSILSVLRPGELPTKRPFRTLREHEAASDGLAVPMRLESGRLDGRLHLYSVLNADAARAWRLGRPEIAQRLARRAGRLEGSTAAKKIVRAVARMADRMPSDPCAADASPRLRRYLDLRHHADWQGLDHDVMFRDWLASSGAWLEEGDAEHSSLVEAIEVLQRGAEKARREILAEEVEPLSTFLGVVARMDRAFAEIESEHGEVVLISREDLRREGLATLGQPVALLSEALPGRGTLHLPMAAAMLEAPAVPEVEPPYGQGLSEELAIVVTTLGARDSAWVEREFSRQPQKLTAGPIRVA
jgi:hypothetical protein